MRLYGGSTEYTPTDADRLWLCRAVEAEGEPRYRVAETLVNGFMWARSEVGYRPPLATWIRAYSQPVNPRWFVRGDLHQAKLGLAPSDESRAALIRAALARETVHSSRTTFSSGTRDAVTRALGNAPVYPRATDFAASYASDGREITKPPPWVPITGPAKNTNRLWCRPNALRWAGYRVSEVASGAGALVICGLIAIAIWRSS
jgi:hypothetical protein